MPIGFKSCPFCGGEAYFKVISITATQSIARWDITVSCQSCGVRLPKTGYVEVAIGRNGEIALPYKDDRAELAKSWNERK